MTDREMDTKAEFDVEKLIAKLLKKLKKRDEKIGRLEAMLRNDAGLNAIVVARSTIEEFRNNFLFPNYLVSVRANANQIRVAYRAFLADNENPVSRNMNELIRKYPSYYNNDAEQYISRIMKAYSKTSQVIHACSAAFRQFHSFDRFLEVITDVPTLSKEEETAVLLVGSIIQQ